MSPRVFNLCVLVGWLMVLAGGVVIHPGWGIATAGGPARPADARRGLHRRLGAARQCTGGDRSVTASLADLVARAVDTAARRELAIVKAARLTGTPGALGAAFGEYRRWLQAALSLPAGDADQYVFWRLWQLGRGWQPDDGTLIQDAADQLATLVSTGELGITLVIERKTP